MKDVLIGKNDGVAYLPVNKIPKEGDTVIILSTKYHWENYFSTGEVGRVERGRPGNWNRRVEDYTCLVHFFNTDRTYYTGIHNGETKISVVIRKEE